MILVELMKQFHNETISPPHPPIFFPPLLSKEGWMASLDVGGAGVVSSFLTLEWSSLCWIVYFTIEQTTVLPGCFFPSFPEEMNSTGYRELVLPVRVDMFKEYVSCTNFSYCFSPKIRIEYIQWKKGCPQPLQQCSV